MNTSAKFLILVLVFTSSNYFANGMLRALLGGHGGTFFGSPFRSGGGNSGTSSRLSSSSNTTHGNNRIGDAYNPGKFIEVSA